MNDSQLARRLAETNRWWVSPAWELDDPDLRPLRDNPFDYRPDPLRGIAPDGLYLLLYRANSTRLAGYTCDTAVASFIDIFRP